MSGDGTVIGGGVESMSGDGTVIGGGSMSGDGTVMGGASTVSGVSSCCISSRRGWTLAGNITSSRRPVTAWRSNPSKSPSPILTSSSCS